MPEIVFCWGGFQHMQPLHPGTAYKNGKLYLFSEQRGLVLRGWPDMRAWTITAKSQQWRPIRPAIDIEQREVRIRAARHFYAHKVLMPDQEAPGLFPPNLADYGSEDPFVRAAIRRWHFLDLFMAQIPAAVSNRVKHFVTRQWHLLSMLARCRETGDILESNSALAFAMASCWVFIRGLASSRAIPTIRRMQSLKRRSILDRLGFSGGEPAVRILSKVTPGACTAHNLLALRALLCDPTWEKTLRHAWRITPSVLFLLRIRRIRVLLTPPLVHEVAEQSHGRHLMAECHTVFRIASLGMYLQARGISPPKTILRSLAQTQRIAHSMEATARKVWLKELGHIRFPEPPLPAIGGMEPLLSADQLVREGEEMMHCVASYMEDIANGRAYVYRLLRPERATVMLSRTDTGWELSQLRGQNNQPVAHDALNMVKAWSCSASSSKEGANATA